MHLVVSHLIKSRAAPQLGRRLLAAGSTSGGQTRRTGELMAAPHAWGSPICFCMLVTSAVAKVDDCD